MPERAAIALAVLAFMTGGTLGHFAAWRSRRRTARLWYQDGYDDGWADGAEETRDWVHREILAAEAERDRGVIQGEAETTSEFLTAPLEPGAYIYDPLTPAALDADWREHTEVPRPAAGPVVEAVHPAGPGHDPHWYASGLHFIADWQAEWHRDAERTDEAIARWSAGARELLAADPWDRSARMLERA